MVIFLNSDGSCQKITPEHVYQGSNNVDDITVVAPYAQSTALLIGFVLPNGLYWESPEGSRYAPMDYVPQSVDGNVGAWHYNLRGSVTELMGELYVAINAVTAQGNTTSYMCKVFVEESVLPNLPAAPEPSVYDLILKYLGRVQGSLVANIEKVPGASNAIRYTDNFGVVSAPIVIGGGEDAPIPVNAASTIEIPKEAWAQQTDGYEYVLTAAKHGQMRDGAKPNDLWVSFDETENSKFQGVYADYSVAANGDITIVVNSPIDMTVRVWNGKGLVDEVARENVVKEEERATAAEAQLQRNIEAETQRATAEENNLQAQIDHIEQSGVDLTARAEIAQEVERATAAEKQEEQRATQAERDLQTQITTNMSDIEGLREDITNESHFRGMFNSVEELRAAYPTATPNDYAWIAGGNIWIWQDNAWTDSREPVPSTAVPASNATPLMDGTASAGTSNSYARGDHRHPSDSNKVSKSGDTMTGSYRLIGKLTVGETIDAGHVWTNKLSLKNNNNPNDVAQLSFDGTRVSMEKQFGANGVYDNDRRVYSPNNPQVPYFSNTDIPSGSNLNNYINPGIYTSQSSDSTLSNLPSGSSSAGKLIVYKTTSSSNYVNQEWQEVATDNRWVRSSNADGGTRVWQEWKYIGGNVYSPNNPPPKKVKILNTTLRVNYVHTTYGLPVPYDDTWTATICGYLGAPENSFSFTIDSSELKNSSGLKTVCCMASYNQANIMSGGYVPLPFSVYHPQGSGKLSFRIALDSAPNSMRGFATNGLSTFIVGNTVYPYFTSMTVMYD